MAREMRRKGELVKILHVYRIYTGKSKENIYTKKFVSMLQFYVLVTTMKSEFITARIAVRLTIDVEIIKKKNHSFSHCFYFNYHK